jgi:AcrR family transcriptional regulator
LAEVATKPEQSGRNGDDDRRGSSYARLIDAFTKVAAERGYARTTIEEVAEEANVPPAVFHEHFPDKPRAFAAAYDAFFERLFSQVAGACKSEEEWPAKVRAAVACGLECLHETPSRARLFAVEAVGAGPALLERRIAQADRLAEGLREGRRHYPDSAALPEATEWVLVAGVVARVTAHLLAEETALLPLLESDLSALLLAPYTGPAEASAIVRVS